MKTKYTVCYLPLCALLLFFACKKNDFSNNSEKPPEETKTANVQANVYSGYFLYGSNMGWLNQNWRDEDIADILIDIGVNSLRPALPETFVETWGYDNRVNTFKYYSDRNAKHNVIFIGDNPCSEHRDGNSQSYKNLYEPIWIENENGTTSVNENNYYAWYVYNVITRYKDYVKFWEIKNEPDFTHSEWGWRDNQSPNSWWNEDPSPADLPNWGASIQSYIRLLRISYEVIKFVDPEAFICVGGIGYDSFLDAILRNTDNPDNGKVTERYPHKGGAWFDCLSFHIYPMYYLRTWGNNAWVNIRHSDAAVAAVENQTNTYIALLKKYGYGNEYPAKEMIITETNVPSKQFGDYIGSTEAQRNYLMKVAVIGQKNQIRGIYPFSVWDDREQNQSGDPYHFMGFYKPLPNSPGGAALRVNDSGIAWRTVSRMLRERKYDAAETSKLALPANIEGAAFHSTKTNDYVYVLWAKTSADLSEAASATYTFPSSIKADKLHNTSWNETTTEINGRTINLTGSPVFINCIANH